MSEKLEPQDELGVGEDEELMSDFKDLFPEDEAVAGEAASGEPADESLDELDAFLDDFEKNLDVPDTVEAAAAESTPDSERSNGDAIELDKSALDLDVGLDGEIFSEEVTLDESELVVEEESAAEEDLLDLDEALEDDELELHAMMDEAEPSVTVEQEAPVLETPAPEIAAAAIGASAGVAAASASPSPILPPPSAPGLSKAQLIGGVSLLASSLLLSLAALWMGLGLGSQIDTINQNVSDLQKRVLVQSRRGTLAPQAQQGDQLNRLGERVNELAVIVEGPVSHLRESNQKALETLSMRLDRLEGGQAAPMATTSSPKPLVSKAETEVAPTTAPKKKGWVINLLSVSSAKTANVELSRLRKLGIRVDKQAVSKGGKTWYRLRVTGFDSYEGAKAYIDTVQKQTGFKSAWVAKE